MNLIKYLMLSVALLAITPIRTQDIEKRTREGIASARLVAAQQAPVVTHSQCSALLAEWEEKDKSSHRDSKAWYERLSTEELTRLSVVALPCELERYHLHKNPVVNDALEFAVLRKNDIEALEFAMYALQFKAQLLSRAETVLRDHELVEYYLLQP